MLIPCTIREQREKVGRRYQRVRRYFLDHEKLTRAGFATDYKPGDELKPGDVVTILHDPRNFFTAEGAWRVKGFVGTNADCEKLSD